MSLTLTLADLLVIVAITVLCAAGVRAWLSEQIPRQLRMQRQLDAIMEHLGLPEPPTSRAGALSPQVRALLAAGLKLEAIRLYRQETGEDFRQAKAAVESGA